MSLEKEKPKFAAEIELTSLFYGWEKEALDTTGQLVGSRGGQAWVVGGALNQEIARRFCLTPGVKRSTKDIDIVVDFPEGVKKLMAEMRKLGYLVYQTFCSSDGEKRFLLPYGDCRMLEVTSRTNWSHAPTHLHSLRLKLPLNGQRFLESPFDVKVTRESLFDVPCPDAAFGKQRGVRALKAGLMTIGVPFLWGEPISPETIRIVRSYQMSKRIGNFRPSEVRSLAFLYFRMLKECEQIGKDRRFLEAVHRQAKVLPSNFLARMEIWS